MDIYKLVSRRKDLPYKIILPTISCCIRLQQIFVENSENKAAILPEIVPIVNVGIEGDSIYEIPNTNIEPISRLEQRIIICQMILGSDKSISISEALDLSVYVMKLFDELTDLSLDIDDLTHKPISMEGEDIMHELADHWRERISFLREIYDKWQNLLKQKGRIDFATYKQNMLKTEIESASNDKYPVIMAGIFPKGALLEKLADIIRKSDSSYLILPPLAKSNLKEDNKKTHFAYQGTLAMSKYKLDSEQNPHIIQNIEAKGVDNIRKEADLICAQIEDWIKKNDKCKIAIVTNNKDLIALTENKLDSLQIGHINQAGYAITKTKPYEFFIALVQSLEEEGGIDLEKFIVLLKTKFLFNQDSRSFEMDLRKNHELIQNDMIEEIKKFKPCLKTHIELAEKLVPDIWQSMEGRILSDFLFELLQVEYSIQMDLESYIEFIKTISSGVKYHKNVSNQNIFFTNLEDADFCGYEYVIISDMNEDSIPGKVSLDPWMSPKMRDNIGLTDLSEKIGIDWYHFKNLIQRDNIIATRSHKKHGCITQTSRFLYATS